MSVVEDGLCGPQPCEPGDVIRVGAKWYRVLQVEAWYHRTAAGAIGAGLTIQNIDATIIPELDMLHYVYAMWWTAATAVRVDYPIGLPRNVSAGANTTVIPALYAQVDGTVTRPWINKFVIRNGTQLQLTITDTGGVGIGAAQVDWFGWKVRVQDLPANEPIPAKYIILDPMRGIATQG